MTTLFWVLLAVGVGVICLVIASTINQARQERRERQLSEAWLHEQTCPSEPIVHTLRGSAAKGLVARRQPKDAA
jgi:hypothetical protein